MTGTSTAADDVVVFDAPPSRRPFSSTDVLRLVVGLLVLAAGILVAKLARSTVAGVEADLVSAFARLPDGIEQAVLRTAQFATSLLPTVALVVLLVQRRWKVAGLLLLAGFLANLAMVAADVLAMDRVLDELLQQMDRSDALDGREFPQSDVIASTVAMVVVASPWLSRRWKRTLWWAVGVLVVLRLIAVSHPALDLVVAFGIGLTVGSLVLLVFGSPSTEPAPDELLDALRSDGFDPRVLERSDERSDGALRYTFVDGTGESFVVTLRTPDERDADLLARWYRSIRFRASEVDTSYASLQRRIEHEALVLSLARTAGVRTRRFRRIGSTARGSAYLVAAEAPARPATTDDLGSTSLLEDLWQQVRALHAAGIAHRGLSLEAFRVDDEGDAWMGHFDRASIAPDDRELARDVAVLLTETALVVGPDRATTVAIEVLGPAAVAGAMRMLQPLALPPMTRARVKPTKGILDEIRSEVSERTDAPAVQLDELERIKPRTLLVIGASTLAFYSLLPQLANLQDTVDAFGHARPAWILGALAASVLTYAFATISFQGAVADPLPFAPTFRAQVAASFAGLVGPAGAGGFALTARFLERVGVPPAEAGASVAVNAIAGFAAHLALMGGFIVLAGSGDVGGFSLPDSSTVLLVATVVMVVLGVLVAIGPVRRRVVSPLWATVRQGFGQVKAVFTSPARVAALFGGSFGITLAYVAAIWFCVEAFGGGLTLPQIGAAYLVAVALASVAPTPGGLGALESAMIAAFTGFGLADGVAVSATLTFRLATFWLPILPGWISFNWMQRNDEL
ncbi:MAG: flippase-like domain-containing protein [Actinobacteria bacterium]|nr:flippase-like domain-containing protein [Actinomycetota bacterium]